MAALIQTPFAGTVLAQTPFARTNPAGPEARADVVTPKVRMQGRSRCPSLPVWGRIVALRRNRAVFMKRTPGVPDPDAPHQRWSRECRISDASFWFLQWPLPSPLAPRKKKSWSHRSRSSQSTPASTSNLSGRACRHKPARPAPKPWPSARSGSRPADWWENAATSLKNLIKSHVPVWAGMLLSAIWSACHTDRRIPGC